MATKYDDIIKLRGGKAAYDIAEEKRGEWGQHKTSQYSIHQ